MACALSSRPLLTFLFPFISVKWSQSETRVYTSPAFRNLGGRQKSPKRKVTSEFQRPLSLDDKLTIALQRVKEKPRKDKARVDLKVPRQHVLALGRYLAVQEWQSRAL